MCESKPHTKLVPRVRVVGTKTKAQIDREKVERLGSFAMQPVGVPIEYCPPGEGEPRDPGWESHKPQERLGFRELDEYVGLEPDDTSD
jgi:hypothetical protein